MNKCSGKIGDRLHCRKVLDWVIQWKTMTPAKGWDIKEQIRHLAYFENRAKLAASNPEAFKQWFEEMLKDPKTMTRHMETTRKDLTAGGTLKWWREERRALFSLCNYVYILP